jgi:hypothetical protein
VRADAEAEDAIVSGTAERVGSELDSEEARVARAVDAVGTDSAAAPERAGDGPADDEGK